MRSCSPWSGQQLASFGVIQCAGQYPAPALAPPTAQPGSSADTHSRKAGASGQNLLVCEFTAADVKLARPAASRRLERMSVRTIGDEHVAVEAHGLTWPDDSQRQAQPTHQRQFEDEFNVDALDATSWATANGRSPNDSIVTREHSGGGWRHVRQLCMHRVRTPGPGTISSAMDEELKAGLLEFTALVSR
jgi:hypothetical protein